MNTLPLDKKILILSALTEGASIRSASRMSGAHIVTVLRLLNETGEKCASLMDTKMRRIRAKNVECDEVWTFCGKKEKNLKPGDSLEMGSQYVFVALESSTKLVPCFAVGKRDQDTATRLLLDLRDRTSGRFQLTTDSFPGFRYAVRYVFGQDGLDYAQLTKQFESNGHPVREGYVPSDFVRTKETIIMGNPDPKKISTSYVERQNLTLRTGMRRFTRLSLGFSRKLENLIAALRLHFVNYNFRAVHGTLKTTPAIAAGITDHIWSWEEILG